MTVMNFQPGTIVVSKAGRDAGRIFAVATSDGAYVTLIDGDLRKVQKPKKKKIRHVRWTPHFLDYVAEELAKGSNTLDARLRKDLEFLGRPQIEKAFEVKKEG